MNLVASAEDELLHFRVPVTSLVTEVGACFQQVTHIYLSHDIYLFSFGLVLHTSDCPNLAPSPLYRDNMSRHPGTTCRRVCEFAGFVSSGRVYTI